MVLGWWDRYADDSRGQLLEFCLDVVLSIEEGRTTYYYASADGMGICTITKDGIESIEAIPFPRVDWLSGLPYSDWFIPEDNSGLLVLGRNADLALDRNSLFFVDPPANSKALATERKENRFAWDMGCIAGSATEEIPRTSDTRRLLKEGRKWNGKR